jgi:DNA polymerase
MSKDTVSPLDENTRRYYLDVMGVQCWQLREAPRPVIEHSSSERSQSDNRDVVTLDWSQLNSNIQNCVNCPLHQSRKQALTGRGNTAADLFFVLLAPTSSDDESGIVCGGEASELFSKMLSAINISIEDVYITSLLKCSVTTAHTISPKEVLTCSTYLQQQIQLVQPRLVVVLGETTVQCLFQKTLSLDDFRTMNSDSSQQIHSVPVFVSYSPEELLQQPDNKRNAWSDLQQMQKILSSLNN